MSPYLIYLLKSNINRYVAIGLVLVFFAVVVGTVLFQLQSLSHEIYDSRPEIQGLRKVSR